MSKRRTGGNPGRHAVIRWAWRLFRREWRQHLLLLTLISVAVALAVGGSTMVENASTRTWGHFGDARGLTRVDADDPAVARATVQAARREFGAIEVIAHSTASVPGSAAPLTCARRTRTVGSVTGCWPCARVGTRWRPARSP